MLSNEPEKLPDLETISSALKSRVIDAKGKPVEGNVITSQNVRPLLTNGYYFHNLRQDTKMIPPLSFDKLLDAPISTVARLNVQPGDDSFLTWFTISSLFPLISACLGPLANMISIIGLAEYWRIDDSTGQIINDPTGIRVLNSLSLFFGLVGNCALLVNFTSPKTYIYSQLTSIISWFFAWVLLLSGVITLNADYMDLGNQQQQYLRSQGHWLSVFTIFYYFTCTVTLSINMLGYLMGKYPPSVNLNKRERALMRYTVVLAIWLVIGTVVTRNTIDGLTYGAALYFCVVSVLTIGLGDILPETSGNKAFILIFSLVGVILMGLVIAMIRQVLHNTEEPVLLWHRMEIERRKCLKIIKSGNLSVSSEETFQIMRRIEHKSLLEQQTISLMFSLFVFFLFWLIGAVVLKYTENWLYFNGVYFCLLCLITIGYGDYAPVTPLGRTFFICWAISAVPLMTVLISNMGDTLFSSHSTLEIFKQMGKQIKGLFLISVHSINHLPDTELSSVKSINRELGVEILSDDTADSIDEILEPSLQQDPQRQDEIQLRQLFNSLKQGLIGVLDFLNQLKPIIEDTIDSPGMEYNHQQWTKLLKLLQSDTSVSSETENIYWISDESPLRLPLQEPNYFISRIFFKIENDLLTLIKSYDRQMDEASKDQ